MVTNEEAADIVISNIKSKGFEVISKENIVADIKAIRVLELLSFFIGTTIIYLILTDFDMWHNNPFYLCSL